MLQPGLTRIRPLVGDFGWNGVDVTDAFAHTRRGTPRRSSPSKAAKASRTSLASPAEGKTIEQAFELALRRQRLFGPECSNVATPSMF